MADELEPMSRPVAVKISVWNRAALDVLGLAGLGAGGAAVFITHLEAGPVALLVVGLILLLVGMSGRMPTRLKVGENEAAWEVEREAVQVFVERVADDVTVESEPELLNALGELAEGAPQAAAAGVTAVAYEHQIREEIRRALDELQISMPDGQPIKFSTQVTADKQRVDAILEGPTGRLVAVETKFSAKNLSTVWLDIMQQKLVDQARAWRGPGVMLLITRTQLTQSAEQRLKEYPEIHHVTFAGPQDRTALVDVLRKVMTA
jgi:hypothetical protein